MKDTLESITALMLNSGILYSHAVKEFKKRYIINALNSCQGNQCQAARMLEMHRNTLSRTIAELKLVKQGRMYFDCYEAMRRKENALPVKLAALERRA